MNINMKIVEEKIFSIFFRILGKTTVYYDFNYFV